MHILHKSTFIYFALLVLSAQARMLKRQCKTSTSSSAAAAPSAPAVAGIANAATAPQGGGLTAAQILASAPGSKSCDGAQFSGECRTADQAVQPLNDAFNKFGIQTKGEKAALLSLMTFESGDFQFNTNHFPGRAGQGTRNMMLFNFISEYAQDASAVGQEIAAKAKALVAGQRNPSDDVQNQVRALVLGDATSFASAAWFMKKHCSADVISGLKSATEQGWEKYITECIGTTVTNDRKSKYLATLHAL